MCPLRTKFNRFYAAEFLMNMKINNSSSSSGSGSGIDNTNGDKHIEIIFSSLQIMNMNVWQCVRQKKKTKKRQETRKANGGAQQQTRVEATVSWWRVTEKQNITNHHESIKKCARSAVVVCGIKFQELFIINLLIWRLLVKLCLIFNEFQSVGIGLSRCVYTANKNSFSFSFHLEFEWESQSESEGGFDTSYQFFHSRIQSL